MKLFASLLFSVLLSVSTSHAMSLTVSTSNFGTFPNAFVQFDNKSDAMQTVLFSISGGFNPSRDGKLEVALYGDFDEHGGRGNENAQIEVDGYKLNQLGSYHPQLNIDNADESRLGVSGAPTWLFKTFVVPKSILKLILEDGKVNFFAKASGNVDPSMSYFGASLSYSSVPEPATLSIIGLGAVGAFAMRRRKS